MAKVCESCESEVSDSFVRVMYPDGESIPICPHCPGVSSTRFVDELMQYIHGDRMSPGL